MKLKNSIVLFMTALVVFASCKETRKRKEVEQIIKEWTGKTIRFPDDVPCNILGKDTVSGLCSGLFQKEYKILLYVDSSGCSSCRLKLLQWKQMIKESDSLFQNKVSFMFFFQPKNKKEIGYLFRRDDFDYPVFIDMNNEINRLNQFLQPMEYQCFLLDKNNKVLMIGNPASNSKIWKLYKQTVSGQTSTETQSVTMVFVEHSEIEISDLQMGKKSTGIFKLKNTGNVPLLITRVDTSCGCTVPEWEKKAVEGGEEIEITVEIQPEETGIFHKTIQVYCNIEKEIITLTVKGRVR